ncbi:MAG TPA: sigma-70 family RNA polymerase sigma factor [Pyrinomonadaceae bacterium]
MLPESTQLTDANLLNAIARQDEQALASLYDRYRRILFGLLMRMLRSREEAEDVLQEVFLQVWRQAPDFDPRRGRPFTWLVTLARSRAIDRLRQLGSRQRLASSAIEFAGEGISDAAENTFRAEQRQLVAAALTELSEEQRRTLTLAYFEGLTQAEIAERLRSPLGTVKTRMRSGMIKLRELLSQKMESRAF